MKSPKTRNSIRRRAIILIVILLAPIALTAGGIYWYWRTTQDQIDATNATVQQAIQKTEARIAEIEAKKKEPVYITLPGAQPIRALVEDYTIPTSIWVLVNKQNAIPEDYIPANLTAPNLPLRSGTGSPEMHVRGDIVQPLEQLFAAASQDGRQLMVGSAYRSAITQRSLFNGYVASAGYETASKYSALPGHSEHQLGLGVDISTLSQNCYLEECFTSTPDGEWLANNAHKFGFALRYLKGKEAITGYNFEPWHYRYVGIDLATALHESGFTLEEAWPHLQQAYATLKANRAL